MRYVSCKFKPWHTMGYTYAYDGAEELKPGDMVEVQTTARAGRPSSVVTVHVIGYVDKPDFECKPILRVLPREAQADG